MNSFAFRKGLYISYGPIFCLFFLIFSCGKKTNEEISVIWENDRAIGISIPLDLLNESGDYESHIIVSLTGEDDLTAILGEFTTEHDYLIFKPLIPLTQGLRYEIFESEQKIGEVIIPYSKEEAPSLLKIYPTQDTVPENLLKLFLKFSKPMRSGKSIEHLTLVKGENDTISSVFLDLQPELWNEDQTMLTVWLDPGRIKRDLIPNLEMGAPLDQFEQYSLIISDNWKDQNGINLSSSVIKSFYVINRDSISPKPENWSVTTPEAQTKDFLYIDFSEELDYSLLGEVFEIKDSLGKEVSGKWQVGDFEKSVKFSSELVWEKGIYQLQIENRLEDLAGNNINRLFETDINSNSSSSRTEPEIYSYITFSID